MIGTVWGYKQQALATRYGRDVEILEVQFDRADYPDMVDAHCTEALWKEDMTHLSEVELELFNELYSEQVQEWARQEAIS